jgi:hypothetical protein
MTTPLDRVLGSLECVKQSGSGFMARCPAHNDQKPSLSIAEGDDGRVLLQCHKGCSTESVVQEIGMTMRDLMPINGSTGPLADKIGGRGTRDKGASQPAKRRVFSSAKEAVASLDKSNGPHAQLWTYHDTHGNPVGVVARWQTPSGKDYRPVSQVEGGWCIGGMPEPRPLYRLPELSDATCIFIVEGEKAAEAAGSLGLTATTSPHGAKSAAKADWSPLAGKEVVLLPDNDEAGNRYAEDVTRILSKLTPAPVIKEVVLPNLPEGGDLVEFIELNGGDAETVKSTIASLVENTEPTSTRSASPTEHQYVPFPVDVLPQTIRQYVEVCAKAIGCDPSYLVLPLLPALAAMIGNTRVIQLKRGWVEYPILWTAIVGESGTMKTPAYETVMRPLQRLQVDAMSTYEDERADFDNQIIKYDAELAAWKKRPTDQPPERPDEPQPARIIVGDATIEALVPLLIVNSRGLLLASDELSGWLASFDRYRSGGGGGDAAFWLSLHRAQPVIVDRKTGPMKTQMVGRVAVSLTGGIQPETLSRQLGVEHRENGLAARLLFAYPPRRPKVWTDSDIPPEIEAQIEQIFERLRELKSQSTLDGDEPVILNLTSSAKAMWVEFYNKHAQDQMEMNGELAAAWSKLEGYAARFALIIHLTRWAAEDPNLESEDLIDQVSLEAGVTLSRWFGHEARRIYARLSESDEGRNRRRLVEQIQAKGGSISGSELVRASRMFASVSSAEAALDRLVESGIGHWDQPPQKGRGRPPARRLVLNNGSINVYEKPAEGSATANIVDVDALSEPSSEPTTPHNQPGIFEEMDGGEPPTGTDNNWW